MQIARSITAALLVGLLLLNACVRYDTPQSTLRRFALGLIDATDLPLGWGYRSLGTVEVANGVGRSVTLHGVNPRTMPFVNVGQNLVIYDNEVESIAAYEKTVSETIPPPYAHVWLQPPELDFRGHADQITIACMSVSINGIPAQSCSVIARYGELVTHLHAQVWEDRWLTMAQFRRLVKRLDKRMLDVRTDLERAGTPLEDR